MEPDKEKYLRIVEIMRLSFQRGMTVNELKEVFYMGEPYRTDLKIALWRYAKLLPKHLFMRGNRGG